MNDLTFAFRQLLKNPGFTAVAVLTLALGIGANTAIFSVLDALLLKTLPVKNPEELLVLTHAGGDRRGNGFPYPIFEQIRDQNQAFSDLFAFSTWPEVTIAHQGEEKPWPSGALLVSGNYYSGLGIKPWIGRLISPEDNRVPVGHPVAVLSYGFWQATYGGDSSAVGQPLRLNGTTYTIIGVTPPEFFGVRVGRADAITVPIMMRPRLMPAVQFLRNPKNWDVEIMGRLTPGQTEARAKAGMRVLFQQIELGMEGGNPSPERRKIIQDRRIEFAPASQGLSELRKQFSEPLRILMVAVGLVLLIACANVANLLLSRAAARQKDIAVRLALGAGRLRLARQLLTESIVLAALGGGAGLLFAKWVSGLCVGLIPDRAGSIALNLSLDGRILAFTTIVSVLTGIIFGSIPAWQSIRINLTPSLKDGARGIDSTRLRLGRGFVSAQVALSLVLLFATGLFVRTFQKLKTLDPGFESDKILLFTLDNRMRDGPPYNAFELFTQLLERIRTVPGVGSATVSRDGAFGGGGRTRTDLTLDGDVQPRRGSRDVFDVPAGPQYFDTFGISLLHGRDFTLRDDERAPKVAIISEAAARYFFGAQNPIGQRIGVGSPGDTEIIGIAEDAKLNSLREEAPRVMYRPFLQAGLPRRMTFAVRTSGPPLSMVTALRRELDAYEANLPLFGFTTQKDIVERSLAHERLFAVLTSLFGVVALALAAVGLYGVMAYSVNQRTREIGLRMALGAPSRSVLSLVLGQGMKVVLIGLAIGIPAALALARVVASRLYGIAPTDPSMLGCVSGFLVLVALLACYLPAWRAARVDPMEALRDE